MKELEMAAIGDLIARSLNHVGDENVLASLAKEVESLCAKFPVYPHRLRRPR
jgi:glycine/serine hydroxymethyltransferase